MQQLYPWVSEGYFEAHLHDFFSDHAVDVDLGCLRGGDVIEDEDIFLVIGLNDQLILAIRKIDASWQTSLCLLRLQSDHHFHLLFTIQSAHAGRTHRIIKPVR